MNRNHARLFHLQLPALILLLGACGTTVQPKYYLLTPTDIPASGQESLDDRREIVISLGPIQLPEYLDRSQIVTRRGAAQLDLADGERWAEPLQENFGRVLGEDLNTLVHSARIIVQPARVHGPVDYRVNVDVIRFDASDRNEARLIASWSLSDGDHNSLTKTRRTDYRLDLDPGAGYPELVTALSNVIHMLAADISAAIKTLETSHPQPE